MKQDSGLRKLTLQGALVEAAFWFAFCTYIAFMVTTLIDNGWTSSQATAAMTAMSAISLIMQPFMGYISDNYFTEKKLSRLLMLCAAVSMALMPLSLWSGSHALVLLNMIGFNVTGGQIAGLLDSWVVGLKNENPRMNYGVLRGTGSLTYALSSQFMGTVTVYLGHGTRLLIGGGFMLLAFIASYFLKGCKPVEKKESTPQLSGKEAMQLVFSSKPYIVLMIVSFCLLLGSNSMTTLLQLCIQDFGGTTALVGTASAICALSEVPCMFLMAYVISRVGEPKLMAFCSLFYVIRMAATAAAGSSTVLICIQLLQGITYAVLMPASMSYLSRIVDERVRSMAVTTYTAVTSSVSSILGNFITTLLLSAGFTARSALIVFAAFALVGLVVAVYGLIRKIWL